jgi:hypothetical protein
MWDDLQTREIPEARLSPKENNEPGFYAFLRAHYYLWTYEKNWDLLASRFKICEWYCRGEPFWKWIEKVAALTALKIGNPNDFFLDEKKSPSSLVFMTTDGNMPLPAPYHFLLYNSSRIQQ